MAKKPKVTGVGVSLIGPSSSNDTYDSTSPSSDRTPSSVTVDLPVDLLSADGVPPEEGDQVSAQIEATVESIAGRTATLSIDSIDGQPIGNQVASGNKPESLDQMGARLRSAATKAPTMNFG